MFVVTAYYYRHEEDDHSAIVDESIWKTFSAPTLSGAMGKYRTFRAKLDNSVFTDTTIYNVENTLEGKKV